MAVLDIRKPQDEKIDKIQWGKEDFLLFAGGMILIHDSINGQVTAHWDEIDHLIAALQKAKELWGPK